MALTSVHFTSHVALSRKRVEFLYKQISNFKTRHIFYHEMNLNKFIFFSINFKASNITNIIKHVMCVCSGHRTGNGQFSFQFQRRVMPKSVQTTIQLRSFHMLARLCSKSFMLVFSSRWTENFQVGKLGFEEAAELEIKLPTFFRSWRKQGSPRAYLLLFHWLCWSLWMCGWQQTVGNSSTDGSTRPLYLFPEKPVCSSRSIS